MVPYEANILRPLDWQRNKCPNITALLTLKSHWYERMHVQFWEDWHTNTFDLTTADPFGLLVWSFILDVPSQAFVLFPGDIFFGFGEARQNYYNVPDPLPNYGSLEGGNFIGGNDSTILTPIEARWALRMKYYSLISNGSVPMLNRALRDVFGVDAQGRSNAYVVDGLDMTMKYVHRSIWSSAFIEAVELYDMLPRIAGVEYTIESI